MHMVVSVVNFPGHEMQSSDPSVRTSRDGSNSIAPLVLNLPGWHIHEREALVRPEKKEKLSSDTKSNLSSNVSADSENLQARLQKRLNEIRARAGQPPKEILSSKSSNNISDDFGMIVVNSEGVTKGQYGVPSPTADHKGNNLLISDLTNKTELSSVVKISPVANGAVKVATIHFRNGSAALSNRDRQIIANALQVKRERGGRIHIVGHASSRTRLLDPIRHKMLNFKISVDRADAVAQELIRLGVKKEDLLVNALSDSQPMYFEFMPTGEAGNRRAEIYVEG